MWSLTRHRHSVSRFHQFLGTSKVKQEQALLAASPQKKKKTNSSGKGSGWKMQSRKSARIGRASVLWRTFSGFLICKFLARLLSPGSSLALIKTGSQWEKLLLLQWGDTAWCTATVWLSFFRTLPIIHNSYQVRLVGLEKRNFSQQAREMRKHVTTEIREGIFILQYSNPMTSNFLLWSSDENRHQISKWGGTLLQQFLFLWNVLA